MAERGGGAEGPALREILERHGLTPGEYRRILKALGRPPNLLEIGIFSVLWSEHCSYKSSRVHLKKLPTRGPRVLQGPGENAGAVDLGGGLAAVFKIESHNHPSYLEPYQGAATGVGGILRDIFTMGARPVALLDSLRFGPLEDPKSRWVFEGVVAGIAGYGNCVGVPTVGGETVFDEAYRRNPLVNVFCAGVVPRRGIFRARASGVGNPVVYVGSKTGRDGIHGATMASEAFGEGSETRRPNVQVGDPFTEKLLIEATLEALAGGGVVAIQDMGAAGLTSSSAEMAARGGVGIELDLARIPRREAGMTPYEIMLSESQERMLLVVRRGREEEVLAVFRRWGLDAVVVGRVTRTPTLRLVEGESLLGEIPVAPLTDGAPRYRRPMRPPRGAGARKRLDPRKLRLTGTADRALVDLVASADLSRKGFIWHQYDHMVQLRTVVRPGGDAAVLRLLEDPKGKKGIALVTDANGRYGQLDPERGGIHAVAEAARNLACAGAEPLGLSDCLNFASPEVPEVMWSFAATVAGLARASRALGIPVVSGNVSFYNETLGARIPPTAVVAMLGLVEDVARAGTPWFRQAGDAIYLAGPPFDPRDAAAGLGGSAYASVLFATKQGPPPPLSLPVEKRLQGFVREAVRSGAARSAHDCSEGGLAVALAECALSGPRPLGASVDLSSLAGKASPETLLFGEAPSRVLLSAGPREAPRLERMARRFRTPLLRLGGVGGGRLALAPWVDLSLDELDRAWRSLPARIERLKSGGGAL